MSLIYTKTYDANPKIEEIKISKFPVVIITDTHTNISNIRKIQDLYPDTQIICLGDISFIFSKEGEDFNQKSINFFMENKIPCLKGNHDEHIAELEAGNSLYQYKTISDSSFNDKGLNQQQISYLKNLPMGFKLVLPDGKNYLCFHNKIFDLWGMDNSELSESEFIRQYKLDGKDGVLGVIRGHYHRSFIKNYKICPLITVGRLSKDGDYLLINSDGIKFKRL